MAQKRMFDKVVTTSDDFLELSAEAQCLYFHMGNCLAPCINKIDESQINELINVIYEKLS